MRRLIIASVIFIVVLLVTAILLFRTRSPFGRSNSDFSIEPSSDITRIVLSQKGKELRLEKSDDEWIVNGSSIARKGGINFIIRILTGARIKSPVSPEHFSSEITGKNISPVYVRVFEGRRLLKSFRVYQTSSNIYGNIMKIKERGKPFIVHVPGYEVNIGNIFTLNELYWQPYTIFNLLPSEISSIKLENFSDTASSFGIVKKGATYSLSADGRSLAGWDSSLAVRYFSYFTYIPFETWAVDMTGEEKSTLANQSPIYRITLVSSGGSETVLSLWQRVITRDGENVIDTDRLTGKRDSGDEFFIVRYFDIDPVLKRRSYFFGN